MVPNLNKVAIITGANSMIGKALVEKFSNENWKIHATIRSKSNKNLIQGENIIYHEMNLENQKSINKTIAKILKLESKIDLLIVSTNLFNIESWVLVKLERLLN